MRKLFTLLLAVAASVGTMFAEHVLIGDLYYNLDATNQTAEVTSQNGGIYSGDIVILASVTCASVSYSVTSIGNFAFERCTGLTSVTIPNSVTSIGNFAFRDCSGLTSVTIPNSVTSIGMGAFERCTGLTSIEIPNSVTSIGPGAFRGCSGLTSVTIPNSVISIGQSAFYGCSGLTSPVYNAHVFAYMPTSYSGAYTIPDGIESIAGGAFSRCSGLTSVTIGNSVTSIGISAFYGCSGLTSITIPNSVTSIGWSAFRDCSGLTSVTIPNSVTSIEDEAFRDCSGLTSIIVENGNSVYDSRGNCNAIIRTAYNTLIAGCKNTVIPNSVTTIEYGAFSGCSGLNAIEIPNSVTSIGNQAFGNCSGLTSVTIPNSVTSIGERAFMYCRSLTSVTIGNNVTSIESEAFYRCTGLTSVTCFATTPPQLNSEVFYQVDKSIPLYVPAGSVNAYQGWGGFTNIQPISAESASVTTNTISDITENSVDIVWPQVAGADQYVIEIRFNNVLVYTITFNSQGQLLSIVNGAPSFLRDRENNAAQALANGWKYTVTGLDINKTYTYSVIAKNAGGTTIDTKNGTFTTHTPTGIEDVVDNPSAQKDGKVLHNGKIYILRDGKAYDLTGRKL